MTSDHGVAGSAGGEILPEPKRRFIAQSLSCSPFHRLEMTEILLKGRKTLTHPSILFCVDKKDRNLANKSFSDKMFCLLIDTSIDYVNRYQETVSTVFNWKKNTQKKFPRSVQFSCYFFSTLNNATNYHKWAPSSEFVSSSIPSWQILTAHAQPFRWARDLAFCLKVPLDSLLV